MKATALDRFEALGSLYQAETGYLRPERAALEDS